MKLINKNIWLMSVILYSLCMSCNSRDAKEQIDESAQKSFEASPLPQSDTLVQTTNDVPERKFVRTAELKFKSKTVARTTEVIEGMVGKYNGFVTYNNLSSSIVNSTSTPISADTLLERTEYVTENTMTIRIPNTHLDSLLREISRVVDFMDYRIVKADDISMQLLENSLKIKRASRAEKRYTDAIDGRGKKLNESVQAEQDLLALQNEADTKSVQNMAYMDQVDYSTVKLNFYQPSTAIFEKVVNIQNIEAYEPSFATKISESFQVGWVLFEELVVFLVRIWALILIGIMGFLLYRRYTIKTAK